MLDSEKIDLIGEMITVFWETGNVSEDSALSLLNVIETVVNFKRKDEKNADN